MGSNGTPVSDISDAAHGRFTSAKVPPLASLNHARMVVSLTSDARRTSEKEGRGGRQEALGGYAALGGDEGVWGGSHGRECDGCMVQSVLVVANGRSTPDTNHGAACLQ